MSWGPCYLYYTCAGCGKRFKYAVDMIAEFGDNFGRCPACGTAGTPEKEGAAASDDLSYEEAEV